MEKNNSFKTGCLNCHKITNHEIVSSHVEFPPDEYDYHAKTEYKIIKCLGCDNVSFREEFHDYESRYEPEYSGDPGYELTVENYPKYFDSTIGLKSISVVPDLVKAIYSETLDSIINENYILSGIGLRAIVEAIVNEEGISGKSLSVKINNLVRNGILSKKDSNKLHAIRFMGNDSAHELKAYEKDKIILAFEIVENILKSLYIFDKTSLYRLELPINDYKEFEELIKRIISINEDLNTGNKVTIKSLLGRNLRRIISDLNSYESELIQNIDAGNFTS